LSRHRTDLVGSLLPKLALPEGAFDPGRLHGGAKEAWLEIGFGGGEHLAAQAERRPDALVIGVEPYLNGVASALRHVEARGLANVRLRHGDARAVVEQIADGSLARVFVLFPDPWPKLRHHKRRLLQPSFVAELARVLKPGGTLRLATDWKAYAAFALETVPGGGAFAWTAERACDWRAPPSDHVTTRYEMKQLGDTAPIFLEFLRRNTD
jgi:tRNA (guanine-N7-)-methyltransferase